jgi:capsid protein
MNFKEEAKRIMTRNFEREEPKMLQEVMVEAMKEAYFEALLAVGVVSGAISAMDKTALCKAIAERRSNGRSYVG